MNMKYTTRFTWRYFIIKFTEDYLFLIKLQNYYVL